MNQAESVVVLAGSVCLCVLVNLESARKKGDREEGGTVLLISLRAVNLMTPSDMRKTVPNILNTLKKFGIGKYQ